MLSSFRNPYVYHSVNVDIQYPVFLNVLDRTKIFIFNLHSYRETNI